MFLFCEIGENINSRFDQILDEINQCDWYLFPTAMQKMLPIIIQHAQQPVVLRAFGSANCTRDAFKTVCENYEIRMHSQTEHKYSSFVFRLPTADFPILWFSVSSSIRFERFWVGYDSFSNHIAKHLQSNLRWYFPYYWLLDNNKKNRNEIKLNND